MKRKLLKVLTLSLVFAMLIPTSIVLAKAKPKLSKTSITITKGKTYTLKVKNNKKKVKWSSKNKKIATVSSKGKVKGIKSGTTYVYAKIKSKKTLKCKVKVKNPTTPSNTTSTVGTRANPANPRNGVTIKTYSGTMYFKLLNTIKGNKEVISKLTEMGEWDDWDDYEYAKYSSKSTLVYFEYDVKAVSGFSTYPLTGLDIINQYSLYDASCSRNINGFEASYMSKSYGAKDKSSLKLYGGASSKMYMVLYVPNGINSFSNRISTSSLSPYWIRYTF